MYSSPLQNFKRSAGAISIFFAIIVGPMTSHAQEKPSGNMKYQVGWTAMNSANAEINKQASVGWKLKSTSMTQCPTRDPAKTYPCVMIVMEREDK
jgi:hypothetical protein